jgi:aspartate-semialdehyde dehydrogenase
MADSWNIAIVGADGLVGKAVLERLEELDVPVAELSCLASGKEADDTVLFNNKNYPLLPCEGFDFSGVSLAIFTDVAGSEVELTVNAAKAGAMVVTNQPAFAYASDIPLVVAGINDEALAEAGNHNIVAVPDASATIALQVLKPVYDEFGLAALDIVALEAVSAVGEAGISELAGQTANLLNARSIEPRLFARQIAFNVVPLCGEVAENGYSRNESALVHAIHKVLADHALEVDASVLQVPVFYGHTLELVFDIQQPAGLAQLQGLWQARENLHLMEQGTATPVSDAAESREIFISRLRDSLSGERRFRLSLVADNVRVGQAENLVDIARILMRDYL